MTTQVRAYIALGSNLGDRARNIARAVAQIQQVTQVTCTSFLYETPPAYLLDQPPFLNAVVEVHTELVAPSLLAKLQEIEQVLGRVRTVRYGPRTIDLDIILYGEQQLQSETLTIPHPRLLERDFVLQPLCDLAAGLHHPATGRTFQHHLAELAAPPLPKVMPVGNDLWVWNRKTYIMGILNITPDSFSGDGLMPPHPPNAQPHPERTIEAALAQAEAFAAAGADCLDIGAHSTRPGHRLISEAEERDRLLPVVEQLARHSPLPLSIDTFRAPVAEAALAAGAHIINDIWATRFDPSMRTLAARNACPLVLMHNRMPNLDPAYPASLHALTAHGTSGDVIAAIKDDLLDLASQTQAHGVCRWQLMLDPGMGFGKDVEQHLILVERLAELASLSYPLLFGPSRKRLISHLLDSMLQGTHDQNERVEGTIALCILAIDRGANLLRVHDVRAVARAAAIADAVLRRNQ